jgi:type I restriction enzyme S subunit
MDADREMIFASFLLALRPKSDCAAITDEFIACWLHAHRVHEFISETSQMTTGLANISWGACRKLPVRFPESKEEQARIAEALRAADDHIRAIENQIREAERVAQALDQAHFAAGPYPVRFPYEYGTTRTIPHGWASGRLGKIADVTSGITLNPDREAADNGVRYLTVVNVYRGRIDLTEERYLESRGNEAESKRLRRDDILVVEGHANSGEIGRAALVSEREEGMSFQNHLFRVRLENQDEVRARFLVRALNSPRVRRHWVATANTSSGLSTINRTALRRLIVPLPRPQEQDRIVERLEAAEEQVTALNRQLVSARRVKQSLLQNILTGRIRLKP